MSARDKLYAYAGTPSVLPENMLDAALDAFRTEVLAEAGGFVRTVAAQLGFPLDIVNMLCEDLDGAEAGKNAREGESTQPTPDVTPLVIHWDRTVIHPNADPTDNTVVCCLVTDTRQPVALLLDDEHREALGLALVEPDDPDGAYASTRGEPGGAA